MGTPSDKKLINAISRESINPQTNAPNPPARIEAAMEEAKIHIDPFKPVNEQINGTMSIYSSPF